MTISRAHLVPTVLGALALALAGCGVPDASAQPAATGLARIGSTTSTDVRAIIGTWTVGGDGVEAGTTIRFGRDLQVARPCGVSSGSWLASDTGALVAFVTSLASTCVSSTSADAAASTPPWLLRVAGVSGLPSSAQLVDAAGQQVAVLLRPSEQDPMPDRIDAEQNVVSTAAGVGLEPIDRSALVGIWRLQGAGSDADALTFGADGSWSSTSCREKVGGRWSVSSSSPSVLLVPDTLSGLQLCDGSASVDAVVGGVTIGQHAGSLVTMNQAGQVTGQFARADAP